MTKSLLMVPSFLSFIISIEKFHGVRVLQELRRTFKQELCTTRVVHIGFVDS